MNHIVWASTSIRVKFFTFAIPTSVGNAYHFRLKYLCLGACGTALSRSFIGTDNAIVCVTIEMPSLESVIDGHKGGAKCKADVLAIHV